MTERGSGKMPVALGIACVCAALFGVWTVVLRSENQQLRAELARARRGSEAPARPDVPSAAPAASPEATPSVAPERGTGPLSPSDLSALKARLSQSHASSSPIWFVVANGDPGAVALHGVLEAAFKEAHWVTHTSNAQFPVRPGVFIFAADETPPAYVEDAVSAIDAANLSPTVGRGYRAYYAERSRTVPSWRGFELAPEQTFVVAIGPR